MNRDRSGKANQVLRMRRPPSRTCWGNRQITATQHCHLSFFWGGGGGANDEADGEEEEEEKEKKKKKKKTAIIGDVKASEVILSQLRF